MAYLPQKLGTLKSWGRPDFFFPLAQVLLHKYKSQITFARPITLSLYYVNALFF